MSGDNSSSSGVSTAKTGGANSGGRSKYEGTAGAGNSTAGSRANNAPVGKTEGEADTASLVRTLALSNFGDRPVFLEV